MKRMRVSKSCSITTCANFDQGIFQFGSRLTGYRIQWFYGQLRFCKTETVEKLIPATELIPSHT